VDPGIADVAHEDLESSYGIFGLHVVITSRSITHPHGGDLDGIVRYLRCPS
jgi:hypothetical protein